MIGVVLLANKSAKFRCWIYHPTEFITDHHQICTNISPTSRTRSQLWIIICSVLMARCGRGLWLASRTDPHGNRTNLLSGWPAGCGDFTWHPFTEWQHKTQAVEERRSFAFVCFICQPRAEIVAVLRGIVLLFFFNGGLIYKLDSLEGNKKCFYCLIMAFSRRWTQKSDTKQMTVQTGANS